MQIRPMFVLCTSAALLLWCEGAAAQSAAKLDPPLWWYARAASEIVGVVQLAPGEESGELELLYMGLVPAARGQGLGRELARACLAIAAALDATRLTLSFDARNASAGRVYEQLGFEPVGRRAVWLRISEPSPPLLGSLGKP